MRQSENSHAPLTGRRPVALSAAVALSAVLLAGCGSRSAHGPAASAGGAPCGAPIATAAAGSVESDGLAQDGVRIVSVGRTCVEYEVTNQGGERSDVTVEFARRSATGAALDRLTATVTGLAPGATERKRTELAGGGPHRPGAAPRVGIARVRSVPSAEAPQPGGPCPASGLRLYADQGDAAMGLRVVGLVLRNCGTSPVTLDGYPQLELLDLRHRPVEGVAILPGGSQIATGTGADAPPQRIELRPGEGAHATLVWRNTTEAGEPVNVPYVRVRATAQAAPVMVTPELDLGTTGRLGVGAWAPDDGTEPVPSRPAG
ncbi:DUF4232 domain-containing protein [Kitasatospora sp. NPDC048194]|uniref:DUF4232 domain-containing protein n=1 Tax=Kitasatospora sp. NPDC048194 TaxID=3364045 RepID=UPI00370FCBA0